MELQGKQWMKKQGRRGSKALNVVTSCAEKDPYGSAQGLKDCRVATFVWSDTADHRKNLAPGFDVCVAENKPVVFVVYPENVKVPEDITRRLRIIRTFYIKDMSQFPAEKLVKFVSEFVDEENM